ncbi:hypothetical protein OIB37_25840 [Streptomyces sp. NBC_00820]|uniref:hypothetical protein n=1 Tax=Streptomyces sp. NBC_00820 TaxID=2975842 RepID=UPI002ED60F02|nr:hypothetical protein OIB37_25840 [Streptomyces sp. NBC_00820]
MNVLVCAACGHHLTEPLRPLPELPPRPADGLTVDVPVAPDGLTVDVPVDPDGPADDVPVAPDGASHAPSTVPRGAYAVDPEPCGAPFVPYPDPERVESAVPGGRGGAPDGPGRLVSAGPRDTLVVHPEDSAAFLARDPASRGTGCCGESGTEGPNRVCGGCGAPVATLFSECYGPYEIHFLPDAVRTVPA